VADLDEGLAGAAGELGERAVAGLDRMADALDQRVPEADDVGNAVLPDESRTTRWAGLLFGLCALALVPWIVVIAVTLPSRQLSPNYDLAWAGFDVMLFAALASTAVSALRRSGYVGMAASWTAALLVTDAWFDVMTAPSGAGRVEAIAMALLVELPLAATCVWLARHAQEIAERRLVLLLRRRSAA
jgi:hypothetical protein